MGKTVQEVSTIAAEWWADAVANPKFDNGRCGVDSPTYKELIDRTANRVSDTSKASFTEFLARAIADRFERCELQIIGVDYSPGIILCNAAEHADIPLSNLPWKTTMWISRDHVLVKYGYTGMPEMIYANKAYYKKQIEELSERLTMRTYDYLGHIADPIVRQNALDEIITELVKLIASYRLALETAED